MKLVQYYDLAIKKLVYFDGIPALLLRLVLAPTMIIAGYGKLNLSDPEITGVAALSASNSVIEWFGNNDWGLGLPYPELLANLAAWTEFLGGWLLVLGLLTRLVSIPLMVTMFIAATTVHWQHGWFAVAPSNPDYSSAKVVAWLGVDSAKKSLENSEQVAIRLERMREILSENGNTDWLYEKGNIAVLNNGIEHATTYFIMLLALFFIGGGRFTSMDYYLYTYWLKPKSFANNHL